MAVICAKCGGLDVSCEAIINPNTKEVKNYTDDSFLYGWCDNCNTGMVLTDSDKVSKNIHDKYNDFIKETGKEPAFAVCEIIWKDTNNIEEVNIALTNNTIENNDIFFYCPTIRGLNSLTTVGCEDFIVTLLKYFY